MFGPVDTSLLFLCHAASLLRSRPAIHSNCPMATGQKGRSKTQKTPPIKKNTTHTREKKEAEERRCRVQPWYLPLRSRGSSALLGAKRSKEPKRACRKPLSPNLRGTRPRFLGARKTKSRVVGSRVFFSTPVIQGIILFMWQVCLWEALFVVSQKWSFPTALIKRALVFWVFIWAFVDS